MTSSLMIALAFFLADMQERLVFIVGTVLFVLWMLSSLAPKSKSAQGQQGQRRRPKPNIPPVPVQSKAARRQKQSRPKTVRSAAPQPPMIFTSHGSAAQVQAAQAQEEIVSKPIAPPT